MSLPSPLGVLLAIIVALFTLSIIFLKINERPFAIFLLSLARFISMPKQRIWHKGNSTDINVEIFHASKINTGPIIVEKHLSHEDVVRAAQTFDSPSANKI